MGRGLLSRFMWRTYARSDIWKRVLKPYLDEIIDCAFGIIEAYRRYYITKMVKGGPRLV